MFDLSSTESQTMMATTHNYGYGTTPTTTSSSPRSREQREASLDEQTSLLLRLVEEEEQTSRRRARKQLLSIVLAAALLVVVMAVVPSLTTFTSSSSGEDALQTSTSFAKKLPFLLSSSSHHHHHIKQPPSLLSTRGQSLPMARNDIAVFLEASANEYDPLTNPNGSLVMLVAENKLMLPRLSAQIEHVLQANTTLPSWIFTYGHMGGQADFKNVLAKLHSHWIDAPVSPNYLRVQAGAGSILDQLAYLIGDPGDAVLTVGPAYPAFTSDFYVHGEMTLIVAQLEPPYIPTSQALDRAYHEAKHRHLRPRILLLCQPHNPTGIVYSRETMREMVDWALAREMHVVSDEIYALSVFPGVTMTSPADILYEKNYANQEERYLGDYVHIVAGLSKDWGMSGFRVGTLFTHNAQLLQALDAVGYYESVSQLTQYVLTRLLEDKVFCDAYIAENRQRLYETYRALVDALQLIDVSPVVPAQGALFAWVDFSKYLLKDQTEEELWMELYNETKILFTTGKSCHGDKPGLFRIVYPWPKGGPLAMQEMGRRLVKWKQDRERRR